MIAQSFRLCGRSGFNYVFAHAKWRFYTHDITLLAAPGNAANARLGMIIGKRKVARATRRNFIKRRVRVAFSMHIINALAIPIDCIFIVRERGLAQYSAVRLNADIDAVFAQIIRQTALS